MKRVAIVLIGILLLGFAPAVATAQGMYDGMSMGVGSPPTALMPPGMPGPMPGPMHGPGACGVPPMPYGCQPSCQRPLGSGSFYAGYLFSDKKGFKYTREPANASGDPDLVFRFPIQGAALAISLDISAGEAFGVTGAGALLIPAKTQGDFEEEGTGADVLNSSLDADNELGMLQAGAFYKFCDAGWGSFQALGGFRWDYFSTKQTITFRDGGVVTSTATNNLTIDSYLPYVGVGMSQLTSCSYFNARVIGFPVAPGNVKFQDSFRGTEGGLTFLGGGELKSTFKNAYFIEAFAEYGAKLLGEFFVGGFGAYNILQGKTGEDQYIALGTDSRSERIVLSRRIWTFGGTIAYKF